MINTILMKFARLSFLLLLAASLTSCQTLQSLQNTVPFKALDQAGSEMMGWISENDLPTDGKPASIQERAREIESRGHFAGRTPVAVGAAGQRMASR